MVLLVSSPRCVVANDDARVVDLDDGAADGVISNSRFPSSGGKKCRLHFIQSSAAVSLTGTSVSSGRCHQKRNFFVHPSRRAILATFFFLSYQLSPLPGQGLAQRSAVGRALGETPRICAFRLPPVELLLAKGETCGSERTPLLPTATFW